MNNSQSIDNSNSSCELNRFHVTLQVMALCYLGKAARKISALQVVSVVIDILLNCIFSIVML